MQKKPKTGDLFDRGIHHHFELVQLKAHKMHQCITILNGQLGDEFPKNAGLAIDYGTVDWGRYCLQCRNQATPEDLESGRDVG